MDIVKGFSLISGVLTIGKALASSPILTVSRNILTTTYVVNPYAAAGVAIATTAGAGIGSVFAQTGSGLVIQGMDAVSKNLMKKMNSKAK